MHPETKTCKKCQNDFTVTPEDSVFYEKIDVPPPTLCPECRYIRRLLDRNEWTMYRRTCDATGKSIVSIYKEDVPFPVYQQDYWKSDAWDSLEYGRDFDFSRPFFEQYEELRSVVPHLALVNSNSVNSEYTNQAGNNKSCYMLVTSGDCEQCMYGSWCEYSFYLSDCYVSQHCEYCYESVNITKCSSCAWCVDCADCVKVFLSQDCRGCTNCLGCIGLRNKQYCWFNEEVGKEEYERRLKELGLSREFIQELKGKVVALRKSIPVKYFHGIQAEGCSGDYIDHSQNAAQVFNCKDHKDTAYMQDAWNQVQDCRDCTEIIVSERSYEIQGTEKPTRTIVARSCFSTITDSYYCDMCFGVSDCLGCFGLKQKQYCILNKQYSKEEYTELKKKIIAHMKETGEWGEYFPAEVSPFAYNESMAQDYFPLTKEEALAAGYTWYDRPQSEYQVTVESDDLPQSIAETTDDILKETIRCKTQESEEAKRENPMCATAFRLVPDELALYRKLGIPVPDKCLTCRRKERFKVRNPRKLWKRKCQCAGEHSDNGRYQNTVAHAHGDGHCQNEFETSYSPDREEIVYCEECYQKELL
ncbi:hypothetical protein KC727_02175 [Candidatus Kaiserbacteria bacterium]|nr:hypothetical protein [Candidatus Kaiserbacteria bacterium]